MDFARGSPDICRVEQIDGEVYITPPANGDHDEDVGQIGTQIVRKIDDVLFHGAKGLRLPGSDHAIPDGVVAPEGTFEGAPEYADPAGVLVVIEVTSTGREELDRVNKRDAYARAAIPLYLLVDRERRQTAVHFHPRNGRYTDCHLAPFGEPVDLPEPLNIKLDTSRLT